MRAQAFPAQARLRQSREFRAVFADGDRHVRAGFVVIVLRRRRGKARLGLAIAKRRAPRAVDRNRIKRVVRESFRNVRRDLGAADIVVLARGRTVRLSNQQLFRQLHDIWLDVALAGKNTT